MPLPARATTGKELSKTLRHDDLDVVLPTAAIGRAEVVDMPVVAQRGGRLEGKDGRLEFGIMVRQVD